MADDRNPFPWWAWCLIGLALLLLVFGSAVRHAQPMPVQARPVARVQLGDWPVVEWWTVDGRRWWCRPVVEWGCGAEQQQSK